RDNLRIKNALDNVTTNVMIADNDRQIIYLNESVEQMMRDAESDIQKDLPNFKVDALRGGNIDVFHKNPDHQIKMLEALQQPHRTEILVGGRTFGLIASPVLDSDGSRLGTVVEWKDRTAELQLERQLEEKAEQERVVARDNLRIKNALDNVTTNVMIADNDRQIIYLNESVEQMMRDAESDIQKDLPNFKVDALRGGNIDVFHKNPDHQIKMLEALKQPHRTEILVGGRTFGLIASPVIDADGGRLGTVVEWKDRTAELQLERQLEEKAEQERVVSRDNLRIKNALDNVTTNVMIADNDRQIIYLNESVEQMMRDAESDIQKDLPGFKVDALRGGNIDVFHKNPDHQIKMLEALKQPHRTEILVGGRTFGLIASPVIDAEGGRLGTVVEWKDRTAELKLERELEAKAVREREVAAENLQIRNALDNVSGNVMIANAGRTITYMNKAVEQMMRGNQEELRKVLPSFNADNLLDGSIDQFHKNPAHQAGLLENLRDTYRTQIQVGTLHFGLIASPIITEGGEHRGTVVEWIDRTAEVAVENEIGEIVAASTRGEFDNRVSMDGKTGFFESLATGINQLLETCEVGFNDVIRVLGSLAQGDLTQRIDAEYQGTFAELKTNVNATIDSLTDMVVSIKAASDDINSGASDISAGSEDLSSRTEEQAASLEETASSMEELTSTVKQNADNAKQANQLAIGASDVASKGGVVVGDVVTRMSEITESSKKIEDIISVIEGIAFQTNILALNAAVEAARAGEQGRGFAVVASEVRSLAQRSSGAAKEIKQLISDSVERIEDGSKLVEQAGSTMEEIVNSVKRVTDIMAEISAASQEQSSGIEQVNQTIAQMDDATQQNAALVEESSASARAMLDQGGQLAKQVLRFRLEDAMETADPIVVNRPVRASAATRPTAPRARVTAPAARVERKPAKPLSGEDNENWSEF
ncbi:MAG: methyl-accepting chemotaxis protein, partial [Oceanococcus sp.]